MKSFAITLAAYSIATASFFAAIPSASPKTLAPASDIPAATGIMLDEVVISSLPTFTLPEVVVSTKKIDVHELPEVVITAAKPKA